MEYILEALNVSKQYPGIKALDNVSMKIRKGSVHALMGENGAGKSTLMKIFAGLRTPDAGKIFYKGKEVLFHTPREAIVSGISMIHQELNPILEMSISENIFLGREEYALGFFLDHKMMNKHAKELMKQFEMHNLNPNTLLKDLSVSQIQMLEIIKAVSQDADVIIMDEPTSAITEHETETLFAVIKKLKIQNKAILYITHKMDEVFRISDEITIFRDGQCVATMESKALDQKSLIRMMVDREITEIYPQKTAKIKDKILEVKNISSKGLFKNVSFDLKVGEVLGISGLMGSGRTEVVSSIFGLLPIDEGEIYLKGKKVNITHPIHAIDLGIALVTEDRRETGFCNNMDVMENISLPTLDKKYSKFHFIDFKKLRTDVHYYVKKLSIKTPSINEFVDVLSGGNQQKVVLGKWLLASPEIIIFDEPTRGIDIGAKSEIYKLINKLAEDGSAVIVISSEMPEVIGISDRVLVMHEGNVEGILCGDDINQENIMTLASGVRVK